MYIGAENGVDNGVEDGSIRGVEDGSSREGSITPVMMEADDDHDGYILGDDEGIITFNPQEESGIQVFGIKGSWS